jgi:hypothetical protein
MSTDLDEKFVTELLRIAELADSASDSADDDSSGLTPQEHTIDDEVERLNQKQRAILVAVMLLGRGDAGSDFNALLHQAMSSINLPGEEDFIRDPNLGDYIRDGISILQEQGKAE